MENANNIFDSLAVLAAMALLEVVKYNWEKKVIALFTSNGAKISTLEIEYEGLRLKDWQINRLKKWGVIEDHIEYDQNIPQSMFDAPRVFDGWKVTELGAALHILMGR